MARKASEAPTQPAESEVKAEDPEQAKHMEGLFDDTAEAEPTAPAEPAGKEEKPSEQTPATAPEPKEAQPAQAKDQPAKEATEPAGDKPAAEPTPTDAKDKEQPEKSDSATYEVITRDGVKQVPVENLVKTYQQFPALQAKYVQVKPLVDLAEKTGLPAEQILPFLELGIKTAQEQASGRKAPQAQPTPAGAPTAPQPQPGAYHGPFKDQAEDEYYKELEPAFHASQWRVWNAAQQAGTAGQSELSRRLEGIERFFTGAQQAAEQKAQTEMLQRGQEAIERRITSWAGDKNDYFGDQKLGGERKETFKSFLHERYPEMRIADLTPEFLSAAFAAFDPKYYNGYLMRLSRQKSGERIFAEGAGSRGPATAKRQQDEQMQHMEGLFDD